MHFDVWYKFSICSAYLAPSVGVQTWWRLTWWDQMDFSLSEFVKYTRHIHEFYQTPQHMLFSRHLLILFSASRNYFSVDQKGLMLKRLYRLNHLKILRKQYLWCHMDFPQLSYVGLMKMALHCHVTKDQNTRWSNLGMGQKVSHTPYCDRFLMVFIQWHMHG